MDRALLQGADRPAGMLASWRSLLRLRQRLTISARSQIGCNLRPAFARCGAELQRAGESASGVVWIGTGACTVRLRWANNAGLSSYIVHRTTVCSCAGRVVYGGDSIDHEGGIAVCINAWQLCGRLALYY